MKELRRLKLTQLSKAELERREQHSLFGGIHYDYYCCCGCAPGNPTEANADANRINGYTQTAGWGEGIGDERDLCACECVSDEGHDHVDEVSTAAAAMGVPL